MELTDYQAPSRCNACVQEEENALNACVVILNGVKERKDVSWGRPGFTALMRAVQGPFFLACLGVDTTSEDRRFKRNWASPDGPTLPQLLSSVQKKLSMTSDPDGLTLRLLLWLSQRGDRPPCPPLLTRISSRVRRPKVVFHETYLLQL